MSDFSDISIPCAPRPKRWSDITNDTDDSSWQSPPPEITIEAIPDTEIMAPQAPKRRSQNMAKAKQMWGSDEQDEDILDRFLKVKRFQESQLPSHDSDGMPSIAAIEDFETNSSQGDANSARRLFAELKSFSNDSNHPDLESVSDDYELRSSASDLKRARELYEELREMSVVTGGSIENLMEGINTSNESISSIIPYQKREEMSRFEMTLKQMIEEAKQMAATPSGSEEDLVYASLHKSPSIISMAESVVSVIEQQQQQQQQQPPPKTPEVIVMPPSVQQVETCLNPPIRPPRSPSPNKMRRLSDVPQPEQQWQPPPSPTSKVTPVPVSPVPASASSPRLAPSPQMTTQTASINGSATLRDSGTLQRQSRQSSCNKTISGTAPEKPLIGADRYEEIIEASAEARGRRGSSVASGRRSVQGSMTNLFQPNATMAMREQNSMSKTNLVTLGSSRQGSTNNLNKNLSNGMGTPSELRPVSNELTTSRPASAASSNTKVPTPAIKTPAAPIPKPALITPTPAVKTRVVKEAPPTCAPAISAPANFEAKQIEPSIDPLRPETLAEMHAKNPPKKQSIIPDWLIITLTYSFVFVTILLLSNITPNGKLYIHFTAFFSMILYFITDDVDQSNKDVVGSIMDNFVKVKK